MAEAVDFTIAGVTGTADITDLTMTGGDSSVYVGLLEDGTYGTMYFGDTLNDWSKFDINKRTKHDASISSGLAVMANNRHLYRPNAKVEKQPLNINISKYSNTGSNSQIIK